MTGMAHDERIGNYFDQCKVDYRFCWSLDRSKCMNYGLWTREVKNLWMANQRQIQHMVSLGSIRTGQKLLDAGCGFGGPAAALADLGCNVVAIDANPRHIAFAREWTQPLPFAQRIEFELADYCRTRFDDSSFDIVWALESVCYAKDKQAFLNEAFRVLRPGGSLIMADGFENLSPTSRRDQRTYDDWLQGWALPSLFPVHRVKSMAQNAGFRDVNVRSYKRFALQSSQRLYFMSLPALPISRTLEWLGMRTSVQTGNVIGARAQYQALRKDLWDYCIARFRK
ncbi:MAG: methyltransferase domain-containing protein [Leptospirales bacterium]|nr:methyltransferase domain-containing protein [Leptospirales bacterium]